MTPCPNCNGNESSCLHPCPPVPTAETYEVITFSTYAYHIRTHTGGTKDVAKVINYDESSITTAYLFAAAPELLEACKTAYLVVTGASDKRDECMEVIEKALDKAEPQITLPQS